MWHTYDSHPKNAFSPEWAHICGNLIRTMIYLHSIKWKRTNNITFICFTSHLVGKFWRCLFFSFFHFVSCTFAYSLPHCYIFDKTLFVIVSLFRSFCLISREFSFFLPSHPKKISPVTKTIYIITIMCRFKSLMHKICWIAHAFPNFQRDSS